MKTCIDCNETKETALFNRTPGGYRPECKACEKERREARKRADPVTYAANMMAQGILKRTKYHVDKPANAVYKRYGIKSEIGDSIADIRDVLLTHFREDIARLVTEGRTPSVDRIDNRGNYTVDNIRIIPVEENAGRADLTTIMRPVLIEFEDGQERRFESVVAAAKYLGCKRDTVYASDAHNRRTRNGWKARIS